MQSFLHDCFDRSRQKNRKPSHFLLIDTTVLLYNNYIIMQQKSIVFREFMYGRINGNNDDHSHFSSTEYTELIIYFIKIGVTKVLQAQKGRQLYILPSFCRLLNCSMAQVSSAQLYWVMYSP